MDDIQNQSTSTPAQIQMDDIQSFPTVALNLTLNLKLKQA